MVRKHASDTESDKKTPVDTESDEDLNHKTRPRVPSSTMVAERQVFERNKVIHEARFLTFKGVDGYDVYNCSVPFMYRGKRHIFGRVERRHLWATSIVRLFVETDKDEFTRVVDSMTYELEDPFVVKIQGQMLFGGTRVTKSAGEVADFRCDFYVGTVDELRYFTSGPDNMKHIRLVQLADGNIGVFTHIKTVEKHTIGYGTIKTLDQLATYNIINCRVINDTAFGDAWGGVNQAYLLTSGKIGCISHHGYLERDSSGIVLTVYCITSFVYEPSTNNVYAYKILGTKRCFPFSIPKVPEVYDCAFASGIVMRDDGKCDLYSGVGDTREGVLVIDYPFEGHGDIADDLVF